MLRLIQITLPNGEGKVGGATQGYINGFSIDTRNLGNGELFIALKDKRDGHEFMQKAKDAGAAGALVSRWVSEVDFPQQDGRQSFFAPRNSGIIEMNLLVK